MNNVIIRGTTPTIVYTFDTVDVATITSAILTIKKESTVVIEKGLADAEIGDNKLSWVLAQTDTLSVRDAAKCMCNWKLSDGTRGASDEITLMFADNHVEEEM